MRFYFKGANVRVIFRMSKGRWSEDGANLLSKSINRPVPPSSSETFFAHFVIVTRGKAAREGTLFATSCFHYLYSFAAGRLASEDKMRFGRAKRKNTFFVGVSSDYAN